MDRISLDEQIELLRGDEPETADARLAASHDEQKAERTKKIQAYDAALGAQIRDVAPRQGLADQILARINRESAASQVRKRRNFVIGGVGAALALTLVVVFSVWRWPDPNWNSSTVATAAAKAYREARTWPSLDNPAPPFPGVALRGSLVSGFQAFQFLNKPASGFRMLAPSGEHAVAIVVDSAWFPDDFDFSATYSVTRDVELEVRFLPVPGRDEVCIFVARDPKPFETKALIF